jgi:hypothetical protein
MCCPKLLISNTLNVTQKTRPHHFLKFPSGLCCVLDIACTHIIKVVVEIADESKTAFSRSILARVPDRNQCSQAEKLRAVDQGSEAAQLTEEF